MLTTRVLHHHSAPRQGLRTWRPFSPSSQRPNILSMWPSWSTSPPHALRDLGGEKDPNCFNDTAPLFLLSFVTVACVHINRYWPLIDDAIRAAAFERKVKIRMLLSCGQDSDPAMLPFLRSLASMDNPHEGISIQIVRRSTETEASAVHSQQIFIFVSIILPETVHCACGKPK